MIGPKSQMRSAEIVPSQPHIGYLDGLRGIAILAVVVIHVSQLVYIPAPLHDVAAYGVRGVQLFFIVSGLTLALNHMNKPLGLRDFFARRFFRIAPMFYLAMIFYMVVGLVSDLRFAPKDVRSHEVLLTFLFLHDWSLTASNKIVPGGWSIACEAMFYASFPLILLVLDRLRGLRSIPFVMAIYVLGAISYWGMRHFLKGDAALVQGFAFSFWITQLPAFVSGCWLAFGVGHESITRSSARWIMMFATLLILIDTQMRAHTNLLIAIGLLSLFVWAAGRARPAFLESAAMTFLGKISFSVYIVHFFVISLAHLFAGRLQDMIGPYIAFIIVFAIVMAVSIPISAFTYYRIELPFVRYGRNLFARNQVVGPQRNAAR